MKLILLEDDPLILVCTHDVLSEAGFEILPAISGAEALQLLTDTPDCLAMMIDVRLAGKLDGWEVARRARSLQPDIAIVYTTTAEGSDFVREGVSRSVLLQKPYSLDRAVSAARDACHKVAFLFKLEIAAVSCDDDHLEHVLADAHHLLDNTAKH